ncbi:MAG: TonB-dependent receptor, partial [Bacteroidales bacterium]|nr:TonB-dependent receptor [Bacteroidales bacterium]
MMKTILIVLLSAIPSFLAAQGRLEGKILDSDGETGLPGANIYWAGTTTGSSTNLAGYFEIKKIRSTNLLVVSFIGYQTDTIAVNDSDEYIEHALIAGTDAGEVTVMGRQPGTHISRIEPILTINITGEEFRKAACCNLSESFETNASVDVNYSDAVTGAKQIQLLGLAGTYVQIMTENYPALYGLASAYGLNYIPGPWMESIQVSKGTASVKNGYEAITGQINVEFKKPATSEVLFLNGFLNDAERQELNLNASAVFNPRLSTMILAHAAANNKVTDHNGDGFRDEPNARQYHLFNRWDYMTETFTFRTGVRLMQEERVSGQISYNSSMPDTYSEGYGININTTRAEAFSKVGLVFPADRSMTVGWIQNVSYHDQESFFGLRSYTGNQKSYYSTLLYQWSPLLSRHTIDAGASYKYDLFAENLGNTPLGREESVPGMFLQYTYNDTSLITILAGVRADRHNMYGTFITPRVHLRFSPGEKTTIRASSGKGFRTTNILAENQYLLASSREMIIAPDLRAEEALTSGINITRYETVAGNELMLSAEYYRTDFKNQVVIDLDASVDEVRFYNLDGKSFSNVVQVEASYRPVTGLDLLAAWRWVDARTTIDGVLREKPLTGRYKGLFTASYLTRLRKWQFDYTLQVNGPGRIPSTAANPVEHRMAESFSAYTVTNAQVTRYFKNVEIYLGGENLFDYTQPHPVIAAGEPFGSHFDGSLVWGPVMGRKIYAGFRFL